MVALTGPRVNRHRKRGGTRVDASADGVLGCRTVGGVSLQDARGPSRRCWAAEGREDLHARGLVRLSARQTVRGPRGAGSGRPLLPRRHSRGWTEGQRMTPTAGRNRWGVVVDDGSGRVLTCNGARLRRRVEKRARVADVLSEAAVRSNPPVTTRRRPEVGLRGRGSDRRRNPPRGEGWWGRFSRDAAVTGVAVWYSCPACVAAHAAVAGHRSRRTPTRRQVPQPRLAATVETQRKAPLRSVAMRRKVHPF